MTLLCDGKLYTAPLPKNIENALDVGTGTGKAHPPTLIGTDISPIQPNWVPPNLSFNIDDAAKQWTYQPDFFDYIHIRWLCGTMKDWPSLYKEAYRCTKPGGWIEHIDVDVNMLCLDGTMPEDSAMNQWGKIWTEVERKTGIVCDMVKSGCMENGIKEAGFTNVQIEDFLAPTSPWPTDEKEKQIGMFYYLFLTQDIEGFMNYFLGQLMGWSDKEMANYAACFRREFKACKIHAYSKWRVVRAQKPLDA
ncbi:hypothetical protein N0V85_005063 [Neurospora sp. IMI 360204]|nr:hypothetical protein N0V85_005063 [Neurospora sp. IMI 360204]